MYDEFLYDFGIESIHDDYCVRFGMAWHWK
jgi:hypothetical protein